MTGQVDEGRAVYIVCLDVSKAFVCHKILLDQLLLHGLIEEMGRESWLDVWAWSGMFRWVKSAWRLLTSMVYLRVP